MLQWRGVRGFLWSNHFLNHVRDYEDGVKSTVKPIFHTWYAEQSGTPVNLASDFLHLKLIAMSSDFHFSRPSQHCILLASVLCAEWARIPYVEILPRSLLELPTTSFYSPSLSLSRSLSFCNTQEIPTFWTCYQQEQTLQVAFSVCKIHNKRREEISCVWSMCFLTQISTWPSGKVTVLWCSKYVPRRGFSVTSSESQHLRKKFYLSQKRNVHIEIKLVRGSHCLFAYAQNIVSAKKMKWHSFHKH